jgi:energy-coupling factor transport system substrate-specific component
VTYIKGQQDGDGGFPAAPSAGSNAQSTAWAIQGLLAAGVDASGLLRHGASPVDYLSSLTAPDGHIRYSRSSDQTPVWVTGEAMMALAGKVLPLSPLSSPAPVHHAQPAAARSHTTQAAAPARAAHRARRKRRKAAGHHTPRPAPDGGLVGYVTLADALALAPVGLG